MSEYISVAEFAKLTGKSETYIRRLCRENKVPNIQEQLPHSTTMKYLVDLSSEEAQRHLKSSSTVSELPESNYPQVPERSSETLLELVEQIKELSKQAGKVELLEDLQKRESGNAKYWQDKYFEMQNQVAELNKIITEQKTELAELRTELKISQTKKQELNDKIFQLEKKGFWGFWKK